MSDNILWFIFIGGDSLSSFQALPTSSIDDIDGILHEAELRALKDTLPLDTNFDLLCDSTTYKVSHSIATLRV